MSAECDKYRDLTRGKGHGYLELETGKVCMIRCFDCGAENWAPAVTSGKCAWCGYDPNIVELQALTDGA